MSDFDAPQMHFARTASASDTGSTSAAISLSSAPRYFSHFIRDFRLPDQPLEYIYRDQLLNNYHKKAYKLSVSLQHIGLYNESLRDALILHPTSYMAAFEQACVKVLLSSLLPPPEHVPDIQVTLVSEDDPTSMRNLGASDLNHLVYVPGIVISASRTHARATTLTIMCNSCGHHMRIALDSAHGSAKAPSRCEQPGCGKKQDSLVMLADKSLFVDRQDLKLQVGMKREFGVFPFPTTDTGGAHSFFAPQVREPFGDVLLTLWQESPEVVPTGEMPRSLLMSCDRTLVDAVSPGTRVAAIGVYSVINTSGGAASSSASSSKDSSQAKQAAISIRTPYLRVLGLQILSADSGRTLARFSASEEERCLEIARQPDVYKRIVSSIAPAISGSYTDDIKKAIACLLFGGTRRKLPDGVRLRGDINVLLLGDPSTAKSQFLKFVEKVAPVGVYTSGKGSSAAGLTASVVKDKHGEFFLEGGAMVLADGGVVCIDEFDKMREQDRVAIHEAMEQQTISIAKAGITTILNSRASVLAAANPVFGTYDDLKSAAENIDFLPTILSRFDMIFIVRDVRDVEKDMEIARHVLSIHVNAGASSSAHLQSADQDDSKSELGLIAMKRYIAYCRAKCAPVLSSQAEDLLRTHYVKIRAEHRARCRESQSSSTVPITVRQLQAIVRIAESLAKMELKPHVGDAHMKEAIRLFQVSTLNAANTNAVAASLPSGREQAKEIQKVEQHIQQAISIGSEVMTRPFTQSLIKDLNFSQFAVMRAIQIMISRNELEHRVQQKFLRRIR